jgi:hypothetical protein
MKGHGMRTRYDDLDMVSAVAGTAGALGVAGRYAVGGVRTARRRIGRSADRSRRRARSDAVRVGQRAVTAMRVLRGTTPARRVRPVDVVGAATAGVVLAVVTALGIRAVTKILVAGSPAPRHTPEPVRLRT